MIRCLPTLRRTVAVRSLSRAGSLRRVAQVCGVECTGLPRSQETTPLLGPPKDPLLGPPKGPRHCPTVGSYGL